MAGRASIDADPRANSHVTTCIVGSLKNRQLPTRKQHAGGHVVGDRQHLVTPAQHQLVPPEGKDGVGFHPAGMPVVGTGRVALGLDVAGYRATVSTPPAAPADAGSRPNGSTVDHHDVIDTGR